MVSYYRTIVLYTAIKALLISIAYTFLIKQNTQDCLKNTDHSYILCNPMFIVFKFHQLKFLYLHCAFYSAITGYFVHIRDFLERRQSITSAMHVWSFCSRAPSGFQYELNSRYITCVLSNAHNTLLWVKIGKIVLFSKGTQDFLNYRH